LAVNDQCNSFVFNTIRRSIVAKVELQSEAIVFASLAGRFDFVLYCSILVPARVELETVALVGVIEFDKIFLIVASFKAKKQLSTNSVRPRASLSRSESSSLESYAIDLRTNLASAFSLNKSFPDKFKFKFSTLST
jgi:hypothetical protein